MTDATDHHRPVLRAVLAAVVVVDLLSFLFFIGDARANALANGGGLNAFNDLLSRPVISPIVALIGVAGAIAFAWRPGRLWEGLLPLGALTLLSTAHAQLFGSPWRHLFYSGLCLSGWVLGLAVSRFRGAPTDESYARIGATALLGAAYLNAGISKIAFGGSDWILGLPIVAAVVAQDGLVADSVFSAYRSWVVSTPTVAVLFSALTVGFELAGPLMIAGRRLRLFVALGLFAMHLNIYLLTTHILYWESMVLLLLFGLAADEPDWHTAPAPTTAPPPRSRAFAVGVVLLALCALVAIAHQARRYARSHEASAVADQAAASALSMPSRADQGGVTPSMPTAAPLRQIGPFVVGDALGPGWSIDSLTLSDAGFVVALSGAPGQARFEVTCAASEHQSPFDIGAAHIFYWNDLEFRELEVPGRALQKLVRSAAENQDVCATLTAWTHR